MKLRFIFSLILALSMLVLATSCGIWQGNGDNGGEFDGFKRMVVANDDIDVTALRSAITKHQGIMATVSDSETPVSGEMVFGNTNRPVTASARAELDRLISEDDNADTGYIIYFDGKDVATYWTDESMSSIAVADFIEICIEEMSLELERGIVHKVLFDAEEYEQEREWLALKAVCTPDVYTALKSLSNYYDPDKMNGWMANLWDGQTGGFYYSISARDNEPFRPDIESTNQALGWLTNNHFINDQNSEIPNDIKIKIVDFAKSMQSESDGYFYHEQWAKGRDKLQLDRYGRDLSWAIGIINRFTVDRNGDGVEEKQYPNYCAPEGTKCEEHSLNGGSCSFVTATVSCAIAENADSGITAAVSSSVSDAVSRLLSSTVTPTASSSRLPDYSSASAFRSWLEATNDTMGKSSGNAQVINALQDEIIGRGYCGVLLDFLDEKQEEIYKNQKNDGETPTGLWQTPIDYHAVWGLLKYTPFYNNDKYGRELKYAEEIVNACIEVIMLPADGNYQMNDIYNQWQGMQALFNNVKKYRPESLSSLQSILRARGGELIRQTISKLEPFKRKDGGFSFKVNGISSATIYGTPIAMSVEESDVNATVLCCSMYRCMFSCFGYPVIQLGNARRGEEFFNMLYEAEPIDKNPAPIPETITFDDENHGAKLDNQSTKATLSIVEDDTLELGNMALKLTTANATATSSFGDGVTFTIGGVSGKNCTVFESDICILSTSSNGDIIQIRFGDFYRIRLTKSGNSIKLTEMLESTIGEVQPVSVTVGEMGKWFKLRLELYKSDDSYDTPRFKIFVNGEYVTTTSGSYGANTSDVEYAATVLFRSYKAVASEILLDNCYFNTETKDYLADDHEISDERDLNNN